MAGELAPLVRPLPVDDRRDGECWVSAGLADGLRLVIGEVADRDALTRCAAAPRVSRSVAAGRCAVLAARAGRIGLDIETIARIELNATPRDGWLAGSERSLVEAAADPATELACRWVLKEAYGKALGVGLALPLDRLAFGSRDGVIVLEGAAAPSRREGWSYRLYRHEELILAIAYRPDRQAVTPFAPAGRKPPTPLLDR